VNVGALAVIVSVVGALLVAEKIAGALGATAGWVIGLALVLGPLPTWLVATTPTVYVAPGVSPVKMDADEIATAGTISVIGEFPLVDVAVIV
jgi:hypothetical protein